MADQVLERLRADVDMDFRRGRSRSEYACAAATGWLWLVEQLPRGFVLDFMPDDSTSHSAEVTDLDTLIRTMRAMGAAHRAFTEAMGDDQGTRNQAPGSAARRRVARRHP